MKNIEYLTKNITIHWGMPLLGLLTAHHWFSGNLSHGTWWILIVVAVLSGNYKK